MTSEIDYLKKMKRLEDIPKGIYCYNNDGVCPYWDMFEEYNGYCHYLKMSDNDFETMSFLFDQIKECGVEDEEEWEE